MPTPLLARCRLKKKIERKPRMPRRKPRRLLKKQNIQKKKQLKKKSAMPTLQETLQMKYFRMKKKLKAMSSQKWKWTAKKKNTTEI